MRKFCLADKTVNSFVIAVYMPMMCWRNGVLVNWKNDDLFSTEYIVQLSQEELALYTTSKEHKATIKKYIDQYNGNVQMAINAFCHAQNK
jgi:hypothetical protein